MVYCWYDWWWLHWVNSTSTNFQRVGCSEPCARCIDTQALGLSAENMSNLIALGRDESSIYGHCKKSFDQLGSRLLHRWFNWEGSGRYISSCCSCLELLTIIGQQAWHSRGISNEPTGTNRTIRRYTYIFQLHLFENSLRFTHHWELLRCWKFQRDWELLQPLRFTHLFFENQKIHNSVDKHPYKPIQIQNKS